MILNSSSVEELEGYIMVNGQISEVSEVTDKGKILEVTNEDEFKNRYGGLEGILEKKLALQAGKPNNQLDLFEKGIEQL